MSLYSRLATYSRLVGGRRLAGCALLAGLAFAQSVAHADWQTQALRLSGESDAVRSAALKSLQADRGLETQLKAALTAQHTSTALRPRALALDVIHALRLSQLAPELWKLALGPDPAGQALLTALSLTPEPLQPWIPERLWGMVIDTQRPLSNRLASLEALARIPHWIWLPRHAAFLAHSEALLSWGGLTALRTQILSRGRARDVELLAPFLKHSDPELQLRAAQIRRERQGESPAYSLATVSIPRNTHLVFFGYKDSRPGRYVADRIEAAYWIEKKIAEGWRLKNQASVASPLVLESKDSSGPMQIAVWFSSIGADDAVNRKDPYQKAWSERVWMTFENAISQSARISYLGHSRDGGGPDFAPPLLERSGHVDYAAYPKQGSLQKVGTQIQFLGLYSCASQSHFSAMLARKIPRAQKDLSQELIYWTDALEALDLGLASAARAR